MESGKIYYIGYYDTEINGMKLLTQPSCVTKMNYIKDAIIEAGFDITIISVSENNMPNISYRHEECHDNYKVKYFFSIGRGSLFRNVISRLLSYVQLVSFLLFNINQDDRVLVYHNLPLSYIVLFICRIKKFRLYYEIEEIFSELRSYNKSKVQKELSLLNKAEGYIVVNDYIASLCNIDKKIICYGVYKSRPDIGIKKIDKSKVINILYAGILSDDALLSVDVAKFLPSNYIVNILGYGNNLEKEKLLNKIESMQKMGFVNVKYHGCFYGKEYQDFIDNCQIGLCCRNISDNESKYAFPSKLLVYLSNNLLTVSTPIKSVRDSKINKYFYLSKDCQPQTIASEIVNAVEENEIINNRCLFEKLNKEFVSAIIKLLN